MPDSREISTKSMPRLELKPPGMKLLYACPETWLIFLERLTHAFGISILIQRAIGPSPLYVVPSIILPILMTNCQLAKLILIGSQIIHLCWAVWLLGLTIYYMETWLHFWWRLLEGLRWLLKGLRPSDWWVAHITGCGYVCYLTVGVWSSGFCPGDIVTSIKHNVLLARETPREFTRYTN